MLQEAEEHISDLEDRVMENNQAEQVRDKQMLYKENRRRELNDSIKCNNSALKGSQKKRVIKGRKCI